ncbi:MAG: MarR family transcriptional regulator [Actinobacteria bacterium]|nr:MAG: MarR family transcriptional regulator [Actinomycetota bacterium]
MGRPLELYAATMPTVRRKVAEHNSSSAERIHELVMDLVRATGLLQPERTVPGHPLSMSQAFALHELDTDTPLSQRELTERLGLEKSSVSRLAAELERQKLLVRERDPDNRRVYRLRLTDKGRTLHRHMAVAFHEQFDGWVSSMTRAERDALLTGLPALVRAIRAAHGH